MRLIFSICEIIVYDKIIAITSTNPFAESMSHSLSQSKNLHKNVQNVSLAENRKVIQLELLLESTAFISIYVIIHSIFFLAVHISKIVKQRECSKMGENQIF